MQNSVTFLLILIHNNLIRFQVLQLNMLFYHIYISSQYQTRINQPFVLFHNY